MVLKILKNVNLFLYGRDPPGVKCFQLSRQRQPSKKRIIHEPKTKGSEKIKEYQHDYVNILYFTETKVKKQGHLLYQLLT